MHASPLVPSNYSAPYPLNVGLKTNLIKLHTYFIIKYFPGTIKDVEQRRFQVGC